MIIKELGPFMLCRNGFWSDRRQAGYALGPFNLCRHLLSVWFDVEEDKPLWVCIHTRPARDRLEVVSGAEDDYEGCTLRLVTKNGDFEDHQMCSGWVRDLNIPYPYHVEIVQ